MHNMYVMNTCPKDQLLIWKIEDGWEPICKFLGKPVPSNPLPHKNRLGGVIAELAENVNYKVSFENHVEFFIDFLIRRW